MKKTHEIKTWKATYQDIIDGKKPFEYRKNDRDYQVGDQVVHIEWDPVGQCITDRRLYTTITYILHGPNLDIPVGYCVFGQHTYGQMDFIRDFQKINEILSGFEKKLSNKYGGDMAERLHHVLNQFDNLATGSVLQAKDFVDDVKTQFKALELVMEGVSSEGYNHTQKRTIANHVINMLRSMVDRIDQVEWNYSSRIYERYNYFRSQSPERTLMEKYKEVKRELDELKSQINASKQADNQPMVLGKDWQ